LPEDPANSHFVKTLEAFQESAYTVLLDNNRPTINVEVTVPMNHFFVMGDNRDHRNDSRYWGVVPRANTKSKVVRTRVIRTPRI
jgi:signal peptidase I